MKRKSLLLLSTLIGAAAIAQEKDSLSLKQKAVEGEDNRNVMLNASSNSGPREVNIGLPSSMGGMTIVENDLPVVYFFWPELPNRTWRPTQSVIMGGLMSVGESTLTIGDFGYAVSSYTKTGSDKTELVGTLKGNHYGYYLGDANLSGRFSKDSNWYYAVGALVTGDPGEAKHKGSRLIDDTQIGRMVLSYKFDEKTDLNFAYKYARSRQIGHNAPFVYHTDGSISEYNGFRIGTDSYMLRSGEIRFLDAFTGEPYMFHFTGKDSDLWSTSHNFDLFGKLDLGHHWTFKHSTRLHLAKASCFLPQLAGIMRNREGYTYADDGSVYKGEYYQQIVAILSPKIQTNTLQSRLWVEKPTAQHNWRVGVLGQYYHVDNYHQSRTFLRHSIEPQPRLLLRAGDTDPFYDYNAGTEYHDGVETKLTAYASDSWHATPWLDLSYGASFQYQTLKGKYSLQPRTPGVIFSQFERFDHDWFHLNGDLKAVVKLTPQFGFLGNFTYQEKHGQLENYSGAYTPQFDKTRTPFVAAGIYYNNDWLSLVSQVSTLTRNNYQVRLDIVDRATGKSIVKSTHYDIKTTGWTTDMVLKPFEHFQLHYLLTLQNPAYENYSFENPHHAGQTISYNGNIVTGISKVLMEIDPSYSIDKFRFGLNFRYFSKQYVSLTNQFVIAPRWESFFSSAYQMNKNLELGFNVVNIFNQAGASTSIATSEVPYDDLREVEGAVVAGSYIRPLTFEFQLNFKF